MFQLCYSLTISYISLVLADFIKPVVIHSSPIILFVLIISSFSGAHSSSMSVNILIIKRYYCRCQCLGSSHMVIVRLVLQPPLCGIGSRQILEMRRLLKMLNPF